MIRIRHRFEPITTAASCSSDPTGSSTSEPATAAARDDPQRTPRTASLLGKLLRINPLRAGRPRLQRPQPATRSAEQGRDEIFSLGFATRSGSPSTRTTGRDRRRRPGPFRGGRLRDPVQGSVGKLRLGPLGGPQALPRRRQAGLRINKRHDKPIHVYGPSASVGGARSSAAWSSATRRSRTCTAATSTRTSGRGACGASSRSSAAGPTAPRPGPRRDPDVVRDRPATNDRIYLTTIDGPVNKLHSGVDVRRA